MYVITENGYRKGKFFRCGNVFQTQEKLRETLQKRTDILKRAGFSLEIRDEEGYMIHVAGKDANYTICAYKADELPLETSMIGNMYHFRDEYFLEVFHDNINDRVVVFLYDPNYPESKKEIIRIPMSHDFTDEYVTAIAKIEVERAIKKREDEQNNMK